MLYDILYHKDSRIYALIRLVDILLFPREEQPKWK